VAGRGEGVEAIQGDGPLAHLAPSVGTPVEALERVLDVGDGGTATVGGPLGQRELDARVLPGEHGDEGGVSLQLRPVLGQVGGQEQTEAGELPTVER
jgi:hypothetical protein